MGKTGTKCGHAAQNKNPKQLVCNCLGFFAGTRSRGRTGTTLLSLVFETNASTDSAIRADFRMHAANRVDKDRKNPCIKEFSGKLFSTRRLTEPLPGNVQQPPGADPASRFRGCNRPSPPRPFRSAAATPPPQSRTDSRTDFRTGLHSRAPDLRSGSAPRKISTLNQLARSAPRRISPPESTRRISAPAPFPGRNRPAPCVPWPDRSAPTTPRNWPPAPSPPCGSAAEASRWSSTRPLRSVPARCE